MSGHAVTAADATPLLGGLAEHGVAACVGGGWVVDALLGACESPEWAVRWRTGYAPRPNDLHDVPLLCARFGIPLPTGF
jgi:lincosamide nucleotidyltransferase A/C/D/E